MFNYIRMRLSSKLAQSTLSNTKKIKTKKPDYFNDGWTREQEIRFNLDSELGSEPSSGSHNAKLNSKYYDVVIQEYIWPPYFGGIPGTHKKTVLPRGMIIDRFGDENGTYFGEDQIAYENRAMRPEDFESEYNRYEIINDFEVDSAQIAEWFNFIGKGNQFKSSVPVKDLLKNGFIKKLD